MARNIRITLLLFILFLVAGNAWLTKQRTTDWDQSLWVTIYPVNGDHSAATARYIDDLRLELFEPVSGYLADQAKQYGVTLADPVLVALAPAVATLPPRPPMAGSLPAVIWWSLKFRYWAFTHDTFDGSSDIRLFVTYFDPASHRQLDHSVGLEKGMIGIVNAFADRRFADRNKVIIVHELLHTLGATDKYDRATDLPLFPDGYADPQATPLYPQHRAEIMGGAVPVSDTKAEMPAGLWRTMVGEKTAGEIGWLRR